MLFINSCSVIYLGNVRKLNNIEKINDKLVKKGKWVQSMNKNEIENERIELVKYKNGEKQGRAISVEIKYFSDNNNKVNFIIIKKYKYKNSFVDGKYRVFDNGKLVYKSIYKNDKEIKVIIGKPTW